MGQATIVCNCSLLERESCVPQKNSLTKDGRTCKSKDSIIIAPGKMSQSKIEQFRTRVTEFGKMQIKTRSSMKRIGKWLET